MWLVVFMVVTMALIALPDLAEEAFGKFSLAMILVAVSYSFISLLDP